MSSCGQDEQQTEYIQRMFVSGAVSEFNQLQNIIEEAGQPEQIICLSRYDQGISKTDCARQN